MVFFSLIIGGIVLYIIYIFLIKKSPLEHIPGPKALPILGNVHQIDPKQPFLTFHKFFKMYGSAYRFKIFDKPGVVVNDFSAIHSVLVKQSADFLGRPSSFRQDVQSANKSAIAFTDAGPEWRGRRKVVHGYIKQYGTGMSRIEEVVTELLQDLVKEIQEHDGQPYDWKDQLTELNLNIIAIFLSGRRMPNKGKMNLFHAAAYDLAKGLDLTPFLVMIDWFPPLRFIPNQTYRKFIEAINILNDQITEWMESDDEQGLLRHMMTMPEADKQKYEINSVVCQKAIAGDLLLAGILTTSATMFALGNCLCQLPKVQNQLHTEVTEVIGADRPPSLQDKENMPYHRATLLEIGRFASIAPLSAPHVALVDSTINYHAIPKGTRVITNLWSLHHDENFWDEPFAFKPERYLDEHGELIPADHPHRMHTMPFGGGQRVCIGEVFAMSRVFLILATLIQKFEILPESTVADQPSMDPRSMQWGSTLLPPPHKVRFIPRH